jgi:hypothetical protein
MVRAALRDPAIVAAIVLAGLGIPTFGSGLGILATLADATKTQDTLLVPAVLLIVLGAVITLAGLVALVYLMRELVKERRQSLALFTERWSATYSPQTKRLAVELSVYKSSESDFRAVECWVDTGDWQGQLQPQAIDHSLTRKYGYSVHCTGEGLEIPRNVETIHLRVRVLLKDGVEKNAEADVNLSHAAV